MPFEQLNLSDSTTMWFQRPPEMSDSDWKEYKAYLEVNPHEAHVFQDTQDDPTLRRESFVKDTLANYYWSRIEGGDDATIGRLNALNSDRELAHIFQEIDRNGPQVAQKYMFNENLMMKISKKMGGVPSEVRPEIKSLQKSPMTIHEACQMGSMSALENFLGNASVTEHPDSVDKHDRKGISPLAYAVGAGRLPLVKKLIEKKANPASCDSAGNSGIHYAAGYGRKDVLEYLITMKGDVNKKNNDGKTPADWAVKNKQSATQKVLEGKGGKTS